MWNVKKILASFSVTSISENFFVKIWYRLENTIFHAETILTGDVNIDKRDLSSMVFSLVDILQL